MSRAKLWQPGDQGGGGAVTSASPRMPSFPCANQSVAVV